MEYFLTDKVPITRFRNEFKKAIADAFDQAFWLGYEAGGGDPENPDPDDQSWLGSAITGEFGYVDQLFEQVKAMKKEGLSVQEYEAFASERAEGYAKTLDNIYSQGQMRGNKNIMLTFGGPDGEESCTTCQRLKGARHSAKWWLARGLEIFRGNRNYECGNWQCQHYFYDDKGKVYTL